MSETWMVCENCNLAINLCTCPDVDERLATIPSTHVAVKWCRVCNKHYARCKCPVPDFYVRGGPQGESELSEWIEHWHTVDGKRLGAQE